MPRLCPSEPIALPTRLAGETKRQCLQRAGAALCLNAQLLNRPHSRLPAFVLAFFFLSGKPFPHPCSSLAAVGLVICGNPGLEPHYLLRTSLRLGLE